MAKQVEFRQTTPDSSFDAGFRHVQVHIEQLSGYDFEELCASIYRRLGYEVETSKLLVTSAQESTVPEMPDFSNQDKSQA